mmetsp:Transcript_23136/g.58638  ORF Transcript_23136/g.58638 Transcript_23136/m.58638 type:complete len:158 (+) Transcript_23136:73-546(+)
MTGRDRVAKRLGCRITPPTLLVEYSVPAEGGGLTRHKEFKLSVRSLHPSKSSSLLRTVKERLARSALSVGDEQVDHLLKILRSRVYDGSKLSKPEKPTASGQPDLNKVSEEELKDAKAEMDVAFEQNRVKPGDAAFVYDKQVEFGEADSDCSWDDDD